MATRRSRRRQRAKRAADESKLRYAAFGHRIILAKLKRRSKGPLAWCNTCSREHRRGETCRLYLRTRTAKSGRKVKVWAH